MPREAEVKTRRVVSEVERLDLPEGALITIAVNRQETITFTVPAGQQFKGSVMLTGQLL